jgi:hypothetical protein
MIITSITLTVMTTTETGLTAKGGVIGVDGFHKRTVRFQYDDRNGLQLWGRGDDKAERYVNEIEKALDYTNYFGMRI